MIPTAFAVLLKNIIEEYKKNRTVYDVPVYIADKSSSYKNEYMNIEMPFGPAAGPHTQLVQNIAAGYAAGARFFELKTVQIIDGEAMQINKPCIAVPDECYNIEWSTELTIEQALAEYIKAYFLLKFMAVEFGLGRSDGFSFNMSVGYDLQGIKSIRVDTFINAMIDAGQTDIYQECYDVLVNNLDTFDNFSQDDLLQIKTQIADSITVSTMHGCPAEEIENIAQYLIVEKKIPVYIKLNPTLNGWTQTKSMLKSKGYAYINLIKEQFDNDLQLPAALLMLKNLLHIAKSNNIFFGVKLTNTLPVMVTDNQLPDKQMYLSGKPLFLLAIAVAEKLANNFGRALPISFSGGIDSYNIKAVNNAGIFPITMVTILLKGKGYRYLSDYADIFKNNKEENSCRPQSEDLTALLQVSLQDSYYNKKNAARTKYKEKLPLLNCKNCGLCINVCPNRANIMVRAGEKIQIVHIDDYCNECGNCATFCPYDGAPYRDKFTVFYLQDEYKASKNQGMLKTEQTAEIRINEIGQNSLEYKLLLTQIQKDMRLNR